jgi:pSer/pThr/pTyr-binding forkhead associated (FHA) protein
MSLCGQEIQIYIPDQMVNARHAIIRGQNGRFFIEQHPENRGPQGQPLYPLQLRGQDVVMPQQLKHGDDVVMGQTLLRFETRDKQSS